jgi:UDP-N-acetylglucosamine acyltransferase
MIHPSSIISPEAEIGPDVYIGPFCVVLGKVHLGAGTRLESHVTIGSQHGIVEIGARNHFLPGAVVGGPPQDISFKGDNTKLVMGDDNTIRECATINVGTVKGGGVTQLGSGNLIMAYVHIAHDCQLGDRVIIANATQLAGHVIIEDDVKIGGVCAINQFCRLGRHSYIAGDSAVNKDVAPFTIAQGKYAVMRAANQIGMERAGYSKEEIESVRRAIRFLTKGNHTLEEVLEKIKTECAPCKPLEQFQEFILSSERGLAR